MNKSLLSRLAAALIVSVPFGVLSSMSNKSKLDMMQNDATNYITHMKELYSHGMAFDIFSIFISFMLLVFCIEGISYLVRGDWKKSSK